MFVEISSNLFSWTGQSTSLKWVIVKKWPGSGQLPGRLSRRYLGFWKAEYDGRVFNLPFDGERTGNSYLSPLVKAKDDSMSVKVKVHFCLQFVLSEQDRDNSYGVRGYPCRRVLVLHVHQTGLAIVI